MIESKGPQRWGAGALGYATQLLYEQQNHWYGRTYIQTDNSAVRRYGFTEVIGESVAPPWPLLNNPQSSKKWYRDAIET